MAFKFENAKMALSQLSVSEIYQMMPTFSSKLSDLHTFVFELYLIYRPLYILFRFQKASFNTNEVSQVVVEEE